VKDRETAARIAKTHVILPFMTSFLPTLGQAGRLRVDCEMDVAWRAI
jgi:hypothetical protein